MKLRNLKQWIIVGALAVGFSTPATAKDLQLEQLADWMTGSFNSKKQSQADESYFNIHLNMVRIWEERNDAIWLYVEQAASTALEKPYRQRVYRLQRMGDNQFESKVFTMPEPLKYAGEWRRPKALSGLSPKDLKERQGCAIIMQFAQEAFVGSTQQKQCLSQLRGATYATSEVEIKADVLASWDRGFNAEGEQVWGAEKGAYIFDKVSR